MQRTALSHEVFRVELRIDHAVREELESGLPRAREPLARDAEAVATGHARERSAEAIDRVCREHADLSDDEFVAANLQRWLA